MTESKICPLCHKEFFPNPENDPNGIGFRVRKYCSPECYAKNYRIRVQKPKIKKICEICGKEFLAYGFVTRTGYYIKYCSVECQMEARKRRKQAFQGSDFF